MSRAYNFNKTCFFVLLLIVFIISGCVSTSKYKELENNYGKLKNEKDVADLDCKETKGQMEVQISELDQKASDLQQGNDALRKQAAACQQTQAEADEMRLLISRLQEDLAGQEAVISQLEDTLKIEVIDKLMFKSGSAKVTRKGSSILKNIVPTLQSAAGKDILIVGHTDDLPPSESLAKKYPSNWELSAARAASIVHILTWQYKIDPRRLVIQGAANFHPITVYDSKNKNYRKTNRVVEIILKPKAL